MKITKFLCVVLIITIGIFLNCAYADETKDIIVQDAWIRALPPLQKVTAAYMVIENHTNKSLTLVSASTDVAEIVEIHEMKHVNGMMKMRMLHELNIPAHGKVDFNSEGLHLMIINLKRSLNKGDTIPITLNFNEGKNVTVNAIVREGE